jgi:asparagine synthase (glutamine-hydrolysing)
VCGITGAFHFGDGSPVPEQVLQEMLQVITHRGPDDDGLYFDNDLALGMRRLSIIDLSGGKQPIYNEDGNVVIVFNGEIYNYRQLKEDLEKKGHVFKTASDTEVIVHLYEEYGDACVEYLRGMFGFAVWDIQKRRLLIGRDHMGVKPMYYTVRNNRLIFGSEIKAILQHPDVNVELHQEGLSNFISLRYVPAPQTMFEGIYALPPAHILTCDGDSINVRSYWDVSYAAGEDTPHRSEEEYAEELEALLRESVHMQLMSDVPFGAFLSGGIDSSTIVALMSEFLNEPVKTFTVGFDAEGSEAPYARLVAEMYQTDHHEVTFQAEHLTGLAEKIVWHLDQPIGDQATVANYAVAELASQHVKMVLTGEGGDELFAGYARYAGERLSPIFKTMPQAARSLALNLSSRVPGMRKAKVGLYALCQPEEVARYTNWFPLFNADRKESLLSDQLKSQLNGTSTEDVFAEHLARTDATDPLSRMLYVDSKLWLPDDLLARGDKTSMATSLEARVPLLDHKLVEFAATVPPNLKVKGLKRKYLLKKVSSKLLPDEIINRKKQGFPIPIAQWFRTNARDYIRDMLSPQTVNQRGLFDPTYVTQLLDEHESGFANHGLLLWGLLNVEIWHRIFVDRNTSYF